MTKKTQRLHKFARLPLALAVAASMSTPASAFQFYLDDVEVAIDTNLSAGASWRVEDRDSDLVGRGNGGTGGSISSDDGNLNFDKNDTYSKIVKGTTDFVAQYGDFGGLVRTRYWYDFELKDESRANDGINLTRELSPYGRGNASGAEVLDAYVWGDFYMGDMPLNLRVGQQVVSWGESTFIFNGINVINPVDLVALRAPGSELKEALLPVNMVYGSLGLTEDITLEAFVQLEYERTRIDDCGTFFSTVDYVADDCGPVWALNDISENANQIGVAGIPAQLPRTADKEADDNDQFGVALRWFAPELNETEFGFYFIQYHSRFPVVSGEVAQDLNGDGQIETIAEGLNPVSGAKYFIEYAEQIKLFGLSFNTIGPWGISIGGEYSFKQDAPVQLNSPDLIVAALGRTPSDDVLGKSDTSYSPIIHDRGTDANGDGYVTIAEASDLLGTSQPGYDRYDISQLQFTGIKFIDQIFGASRLALVAEIGGTFVHSLPDLGVARYGRFDGTSFGITPDYNPTDGVSALEACQDINKIGTCNTDGYVTDFSWGYRARAALTYNNAIAGVNLTPQVAWSHDVSGNAPGPGANFIEDRKSFGLSLKADYLNQYSANISYTNYFGGEPYNAIADRDNVALSVAYSF